MEACLEIKGLGCEKASAGVTACVISWGQWGQYLPCSLPDSAFLPVARHRQNTYRCLTNFHEEMTGSWYRPVVSLHFKKKSRAWAKSIFVDSRLPCLLWGHVCAHLGQLGITAHLQARTCKTHLWPPYSTSQWHLHGMYPCHLILEFPFTVICSNSFTGLFPLPHHCFGCWSLWIFINFQWFPVLVCHILLVSVYCDRLTGTPFGSDTDKWCLGVAHQREWIDQYEVQCRFHFT